MQIKLITDNAIRMITYLVTKNGVANSKEIAQILDVPQKNILSIGRQLKAKNYIKIISGPYGGYTANILPEKIFIYDIVSIFENIQINCLAKKQKSTDITVSAAMDNLYSELQCVIEEKLKTKTLADLISDGIAYTRNEKFNN